MVTDVSAGEELLPEIYALESMDGSHTQRLVLPADGIDNGAVLELRFSNVPCHLRYRLDVEIAGVGRYRIFEDLAYGDLHKHANGTLTEMKKDGE